MGNIGRTYIYFSLTVCVIAALYFVSQNWKNQLVLQHVQVFDARILTNQEVKTIADVRKGSPLFKLSLAKISRRVEENPFVKEAVVVRALPYDLSITVHERNPIALVATPTAVLSVDGSGVVLPLPLARKGGLPLITDVSKELGVGDTVHGSVMQAVEFIRDAEEMGDGLSANIAEVRIENRNLVAFTTARSVPVIVGNGDLWRKLVYLHEFLTKLGPADGSRCQYVDLRYNGQIVLGMQPYGKNGNAAHPANQSAAAVPVAENSGKVN